MPPASCTPEFLFRLPDGEDGPRLGPKERQRLEHLRLAVNDALEARVALIKVVRRLADNARTMESGRKMWAGVKMVFSVVGELNS